MILSLTIHLLPPPPPHSLCTAISRQYCYFMAISHYSCTYTVISCQSCPCTVNSSQSCPCKLALCWVCHVSHFVNSRASIQPRDRAQSKQSAHTDPNLIRIRQPNTPQNKEYLQNDQKAIRDSSVIFVAPYWQYRISCLKVQLAPLAQGADSEKWNIGLDICKKRRRMERIFEFVYTFRDV